jgi:twitching motility protein PilT
LTDINNLINHLLEYATKQGADLHICPKSAPFARLGGKNSVLQPVQGFEDWILDVGTVKTLISELLTPEQRVELLKHKYADVSYTHGELGRFRVSVYAQRGTHAITIHTLPFDVPDLHKLDLPVDIVTALENTVMENVGLVIAAGDYFSDKSVIIAALVDSINRKRNCHISTIEKPIKYLHRHKKSMVIQKEIGIDVADFKTALEQIRQENPDVVVLNELQHDDFLSVMTLAEERLVLASLRTNAYDDGDAEGALSAVQEIKYEEAVKTEHSRFMLPKPLITVLLQDEHGDYTIAYGGRVNGGEGF